MDEWVVAHIIGREGFSCEVRNSITELVVTSCDEAVLVSIQGMKDIQFCVVATSVRMEV